MKKLNITKETFEKSKYFTRKYGKLAFVSESGKLFKTSKGNILKFTKESLKREVMPMNGRKSFGHKAVEEEDDDGFTLFSYETPVAKLERREDGSGMDFTLLSDYLSSTTLTHIHSWLIGHNQKDIPTKELLQMNVGDSVPMMAAESKKLAKEAGRKVIPAENGCNIHDMGDCFIVTNKNGLNIGQCRTMIEAEDIAENADEYTKRKLGLESKKLVKEGAGAGYTVTIKNVKLANAKVINRSKDGDWEFVADIVKDSYMVEAEDYYNRFCPISEYDEEWVEVAGKVYGVCWWYEEERDVERQVNGQEQDIGFDYGAGWVHADLPKDGHITADRIRADEHDTWAIQSIELFAPQVSECVNYCHEHFLDEEEGGEEEEVDESKLAKETSDDLTLDEIYKAVKEEYGGKLFSDNFLKLNIEHVSGQVLCIFELDRPDDMGANDGDDEWWEDKKDSAILFYDELVKFLVDKFGEKFRFTDPRVSDEYADKSDPKAAFEIFIDEDDATLPIITIDEVADGWYAESEGNENGTIDGWRVFDYGEEFPYVERYEVLDPDGYPFFIDHNGGVGSFPEDAIEGSSEEVCDALEIEIKDKMYKPRELTEREILDNPVVQKGLKRIKVKFQYEKED